MLRHIILALSAGQILLRPEFQAKRWKHLVHILTFVKNYANDGLSLSEDPTKTEINLKFKYVVEILAVQV